MKRKLSRKQWKRKRGLKRIIAMGMCVFLMAAMFSIIFPLLRKTELKGDYPEKLGIDVRLLTPNEYSRPQIILKKVKGVVIHYTANPGTDAIANRNYFDGLKDSHKTYASSHFLVGLKGDIVQCIPANEIAYASNERNIDTISIEVCHPDKSGKFNKKTYDALIELVAWLSCEYNLDRKDIIRHYDVTGKICPKYYVDHEDKWEELKDDIFQYIKDNKK